MDLNIRDCMTFTESARNNLTILLNHLQQLREQKTDYMTLHSRILSSCAAVSINLTMLKETLELFYDDLRLSSDGETLGTQTEDEKDRILDFEVEDLPSEASTPVTETVTLSPTPPVVRQETESPIFTITGVARPDPRRRRRIRPRFVRSRTTPTILRRRRLSFD